MDHSIHFLEQTLNWNQYFQMRFYEEKRKTHASADLSHLRLSVNCYFLKVIFHFLPDLGLGFGFCFCRTSTPTHSTCVLNFQSYINKGLHKN